jgi:ferrous iron transport protein A
MTATATTLDKLKIGQKARVTAVLGEDPLMQRILEMGLIDGEDIEVLGFAPLGDPMEILLRDYRLSLRRREAARIQVAIL